MDDKLPIKRGFDFLRTNTRSRKPRTSGITEIRGPYYTVMGKRYLKDVLETMGEYIDSIKFAGGSFTLFPEEVLREFIDVAHSHHVLVSTGGFIEYVITQGKSAVKTYIKRCKELGFDTIEISSGFITYPVEDWVALIDMVQDEGLNAKPEVGIQFGAGGATAQAELKAEGTRDVRHAIHLVKRLLQTGVPLIMIESEGITENTEPWRTDVIAALADAVGIERLMFEAAEPSVFEWYVKTYGHQVNLFVDHSQIVQLECLRSGIWGTKGTWGRIQGL